MDTTTIRMDRDAHSRLLDSRRERGESLTETVRQAARALRRLRYGQRVQEEFAALRAGPEAWCDYRATAESSNVADGLD